MVKAVEAARKAQESLYNGICTVTEHRKVTNEKTSALNISITCYFPFLRDLPASSSAPPITS